MTPIEKTALRHLLLALLAVVVLVVFGIEVWP